MKPLMEERATKNALDELAEAASRVQALAELKEFAAIKAMALGAKGTSNSWTTDVREAVGRLQRIIVDAEEVQHRLRLAISSCRKDEVTIGSVCTSGAVVTEVAGARDTVERARTELQAWEVALQSAIRRAQQVAGAQTRGVGGRENVVGNLAEVALRIAQQHSAMGPRTGTQEWPLRALVGPRGGRNG